MQKLKKIKWKKTIFAGVLVVVVVVVNLLDLILLLQIFFHAKSGGCSFKIGWVMAILVWLKKVRILTDSLTDWFYRYIVVRLILNNYLDIIKYPISSQVNFKQLFEDIFCSIH